MLSGKADDGGGAAECGRCGGALERVGIDDAGGGQLLDVGMGIDATVPFGYEEDFLRPVYPIDKVKPEDFFSKKDIENAKSRMVGWVNSLARTGR